MSALFRVGVLASGTGTNLQAILDQLHNETVEVVAVGSDRPGAGALERAAAAGVAPGTFPIDGYPDRDEHPKPQQHPFPARDVDLVVLAGYMQLLSPEFVRRFADRIVNVHPALLPSFAGLDAIGQALEHGVKVTGVTVHFVDEGVDTGPIVLQQPVPVPADGDREALESAIHAVEHALLPEAIRLIAAGRVSVDESQPRRVRIEP